MAKGGDPKRSPGEEMLFSQKVADIRSTSPKEKVTSHIHAPLFRVFSCVRQFLSGSANTPNFGRVRAKSSCRQSHGGCAKASDTGPGWR